MRLIVSLVLLAIICSCTKKHQKKLDDNGVALKQTDSVVKTRVNLLTLDAKVLSKLEGISSFELVSQEIDSVKKLSLKRVEEVIPELNQNITEFINELPVELKNKPVLGRLSQLKTYGLLLEDTFVNQKNNDPIILNNTLNKVLESYNVLVVQLNETENKISEDFQKELEKAAFDRDSLKQSEVAPLF